MKYRDRKMEDLVDQLTEAMESCGGELWDEETVIALLENMAVHLKNPIKEGGEPEERKLLAYFNFVPKHCPNCGASVHWPGDRLIVNNDKEKYGKGNKRTCSFCHLQHSHMLRNIKGKETDTHDPGKQRNLQALYNFFPKHCPNCGTRVHWKGETLIDVFLDKKKYGKGERAQCTHCGLDHHRMDVKV